MKNNTGHKRDRALGIVEREYDDGTETLTIMPLEIKRTTSMIVGRKILAYLKPFEILLPFSSDQASRLCKL
jgi:hypothetical protein